MAPHYFSYRQKGDVVPSHLSLLSPQFESQYLSAVEEAERTLRTGLLRKGLAAEALAAGYTFEPGTPSLWPRFWVRGSHVTSLRAVANKHHLFSRANPASAAQALSESVTAAVSARSVAVSPIIYERDAAAWQRFFEDETEAILGPDIGLLSEADRQSALSRIRLGPFDPGVSSMTVGHAQAQPVSTGGLAPFVAPIFQVSPLTDVWAAVMVNVNNETQNQVSIASFLGTDKPHCSDVFNLVEDKVRGLWRPSSIVRAPSFWRDPGNASADPQPTGFAGVVFSWDTVLNQSLATNTEGIVVVINGPVTSTTFVVERGTVTSLFGCALPASLPVPSPALRRGSIVCRLT